MSAKAPVTSAIRALRAAHIVYSEHLYPYQEHGGTAHSAAALGLEEHAVVKTLILQDDRKRPLCVLMHGDRKVSTKELARWRGDRSIVPCEPAVAERHTGYQVGGTSPFGLRTAMPVYVEASILALPRVWLNGGKRGFLVGIDSQELVRVLGAVAVEVAIEG